MRLRPYGDSGPLAMSYDMLEKYLHTQGREWERYAWVKARRSAAQAPVELDAIVTPFVYRRYLDYSAIASLRELHAQIRAEVARRDMHDNIKLGPGGIREIEFITQVFQIVRGGQDAGTAAAPDARHPRVPRAAPVAAGRCRRGSARGLRVPAQSGAPSAVPGRSADPDAASRRSGSETVAQAMGCADAVQLRATLERTAAT